MQTETEAKFIVEAPEILWELSQVTRIGEYTLTPLQVQDLTDTYLDTEDRALLQAGYACRARESQGQLLITVKGLARPMGTSDGIHRREELQVALPQTCDDREVVDVRSWPESQVRSRVLSIIGQKPLTPWFTLRQVRSTRKVLKADTPIAELCLDEMRLDADIQGEITYGLELELLEGGSEADLHTLVAGIAIRSGLRPETKSKFERAIAQLEKGRENNAR